MSTVGQIERATQNRVVKQFKNTLKYRYLGNWEERENNSNIEADILKEYLKNAGYSETLINKAVYQFTKTAEDQSKSLYDVNHNVYALLRYGVKVKEDAGENTQTVWLINWKEPYENDFAIAEEVTVKGVHNKRPDLVLYVNGIALAVLELKRSTVSVSEGIRQNLDNQKHIFIKQFFTTSRPCQTARGRDHLAYPRFGKKPYYGLAHQMDSRKCDQCTRLDHYRPR